MSTITSLLHHQTPAELQQMNLNIYLTIVGPRPLDTTTLTVIL